MPDGGATSHKRVEPRETVVIRFAGDSGDGMQVTGMQFTTESAIAGNDLATLPDFPAEIRAPAGTLAGVSAFQLNFSANEVFTPGDDLDVLVAMNPAALKVNLADLKVGGILIVDREGFNEPNLKKADYATNPLDDGTPAADVTRQPRVPPRVDVARPDPVADREAWLTVDAPLRRHALVDRRAERLHQLRLGPRLGRGLGRGHPARHKPGGAARQIGAGHRGHRQRHQQAGGLPSGQRPERVIGQESDAPPEDEQEHQHDR